MLKSRRVAINRRVRGSSPLSGAISTRMGMVWVYVVQNPAGGLFAGSQIKLDHRAGIRLEVSNLHALELPLALDLLDFGWIETFDHVPLRFVGVCVDNAMRR